MSFDGIVPTNQHVNISQDKYYKLARHCVTLKNIFDNHFKETEYADVIYENCSDKNGNSTNSTFDISQSLKMPTIILRFLKGTKYNRVTYKHIKIVQ